MTIALNPVVCRIADVDDADYDSDDSDDDNDDDDDDSTGHYDVDDHRQRHRD